MAATEAASLSENKHNSLVLLHPKDAAKVSPFHPSPRSPLDVRPFRMRMK